MNTRALAAESILDILNQKYSLLTLDNKLTKKSCFDQNKAFIKLLCYEFFRNYFSLEKILAKYLKPNTKHKVKILTMLGALQILEINQPVYASINETVNACKQLNILWAKKLVNGVLRNLTRDIDLIKIKYLEYKAIDLPKWLIDELKNQYPTNYLEIAEDFNSKADMFIRLNNSKKSDKTLKHLQRNNISYTLIEEIKNCLKLSKPIDVQRNSLFLDGYFTIQDMSAQYAGWIVNPQDDDSILDACAAPGGKTTHLLELNPRTNITAIDIVDKRLTLLKNNLNRINTQNKVKIIKHDLTKRLDGSFNKIILDAPCTALGTIKRNPDIKVIRNSKDVKNIQTVQQQILQNLWENNLENNGYLLYITCSILEQENQQQIQSFLKRNSNAKVIDIPSLKSYQATPGYQLLPTKAKGDGFYYCLIKKIT